MRKYVAIFAFVFLLLPLAWAKEKEAGFLPQSFNGWQKIVTAASKTSSDPAVASPVDSAVLKEYGFSDVELSTYTREGRSIRIKAARFADASGAYGAFTFYAQPQMQTTTIGDQGVTNDTRVLFYRGNILVDADLDRVTAMSAADLRALSEALPQPRGANSALPTLPGNLPHQSRVAHSEHYITGPAALERLGVPVPASLVDFTKAPEVATARYRSSFGEAGLTLIGYPTPQIAMERIRAMQSASLPGGPFYFKRTGPIVALVNGQVPAAEAASLLASVNYDAEVTWNQPTKLNPKDNPVEFLLAVLALAATMVLLALVFGFVFGGLRVMLRAKFPNSALGRSADTEFIRLNLK